MRFAAPRTDAGAGCSSARGLPRDSETAEPVLAKGQSDIAQNRLGGPGLWLRAEPDEDSAQADSLAAIHHGSRRMSRLPLSFGCGQLRLAATLDTALGTTGLLIVSVATKFARVPFSGQAAARRPHRPRRVFPVFRFATGAEWVTARGENRGFRHSAKDIAARAPTPSARLAPQVSRWSLSAICIARLGADLAGGRGTGRRWWLFEPLDHRARGRR